MDNTEAEAAGVVSDTSEDLVSLGGADCLSSAEAHATAAEYGAEVVLIAGEFASGKTTLLVELYGQFLAGPIDGWLFAGSKTLVALDKRHFPTRYASGNTSATTKRTHEEDEGLIHLRLANDSRTVALFFTDLRGERFEHVRDGVAAGGEIPYVGRADRTLLLIDGAKIADLESRQTAIHNARMLIGGLTEQGGRGANHPMAIVLTKRDLVDEAKRMWFAEQARGLIDFAGQQDAVASVMSIAARPATSPDEPECLDEVLRWLTQEKATTALPAGSRLMPGDRQFWRVSDGR